MRKQQKNSKLIVDKTAIILAVLKIIEQMASRV